MQKTGRNLGAEARGVKNKTRTEQNRAFRVLRRVRLEHRIASTPRAPRQLAGRDPRAGLTFLPFSPSPRARARSEAPVGLQEVSHANQEPGLDSLTVSTVFAVPGRAAELNGLEVYAVDVERQQRRIAIGSGSSAARMVPAHARAKRRTSRWSGPGLALLTPAADRGVGGQWYEFLA